MGIRKGYQSNLEANIEPNGLNEVELKWSSSNEAVAEVNIYGGITGKAEGEAVITVEALDGSGVKATCQVIVGELVTTIEKTSHETIKAIDELGNTVTVPGGFKIAEDSGGTVKEGIVIEDSDGNQFVWIPVSNIDGGTDVDNNKLLKVETEDGATEEVEITLGRYTAFTETAEPVQLGQAYADDMNESYRINTFDYELNTSTTPEGLESYGEDGKNAIYQTLGAFVESVKENHGYYIGRYEASYESGDTFGDATTQINYKMVSKVSDPSATSTKEWANTNTARVKTLYLTSDFTDMQDGGKFINMSEE